MCSVYPFVFSFLFVMTTNQKKQLPQPAVAQSGPNLKKTEPKKVSKEAIPLPIIIKQHRLIDF